MKYNKRFLQKTDDKKHLRKVKKNWVVVSMASFAFLGAAAALTTSTTEGPANASDVTQTVTTHDKVETKTTTRTIKLVDKDTKQEIANVEPIKQTVNWTRTNKVDDQGNVVSEGTWQAVDQNGQYATLMYKDLDLTSKGYTNPQIDGKDVTKSDAKNAAGQTITENDDKTADGQDVVKVKAAAADATKGDEEVTVTYTKAADTTSATTTTTQAASTVSTTAADTTTTEATGTKEVTNTKTTTRTIKYVAPDYDDQEMAKTVTQTINWKQVNTVDASGKVIKEGAWVVADGSAAKYAAVTTPTVKNFTVDQATVAEQNATANDKDQTITVKYTFGDTDTTTATTMVASDSMLRASAQTGKYGTVSYSYDSSSATLTFTSGGSFPSTDVGGNIYSLFPNVKHIVFTEKVYAGPNSSGLFSNLQQLKDFTNMGKLNTSKVNDMSYMFSMGATANTSLRILDLSGFDTSKVTNMQFMFQNLTGLYKLDISNFKMSAATDLQGDSQMFDLMGDGDTIYVKLPSQHFNTLADLGSTGSNSDSSAASNSRYPIIVPIGNGSLDQPEGPGIYTAAYRTLFDSGKHPGGWYLWGRDTKWTQRESYTQTIKAVDSKGNLIKVLRVETAEFTRSASKNYITNKITGEYSSWKLDTDVRDQYDAYDIPQSLDDGKYTDPTIDGSRRYKIYVRTSSEINRENVVFEIVYAENIPTDSHGTDTDQTITRKVHLRDESNGNAEFDADDISSRTETIHFHRSGTVNSVTGVFTPTTSWTAVDGSASFAGYAAPDMKSKGYDLDTPSTTDAITPSQADITAGKSYDQDIYYKHHTGKVTPDGPVGPVDPVYPPVDPAKLKEQLTKTYTRTVHFIDATGKTLAPDKVETITATGEADYDYVTKQIVGQITWSYKSDSEKDWEAVVPAASIDLDGKYYYDPKSNKSLAQQSFDIQNDGAVNEDVNVVYKTGTDTSESKTITRVVHLRDSSDGNAEFDQANLASRTQTLTYTRAGYKDEDGNFHATGQWVAEPATNDSFAAFATPDESGKGYDFDRNATTAVTPSQDDITNGVTYNQDIFYTHHKGKITPDGPVGPVNPVYPPVNPDVKKQLVKTYTRTVHFVGSDGKTVAPDKVETVTAYGEADYDYVTGQIDGPITWSYKAGSDETWAVVTPKATIDLDGKHYYDPSASDSLAEKSFDVQNDAAQNADVTVTYKTATPTNNHGADTDKTATRQFHLIDDTDSHEFDADSINDRTQTVHFHRDGYVDDVTGDFIPAGDWQAVDGDGNFAAYTAPDESQKGYDLVSASEIAGQDVDKETVVNGENINVDIHYKHHKSHIGPNTPDDPKHGPKIPDSVRKELQAEVKRNIHFKDAGNPNGADIAPEEVQTVALNGDADYDFVTGKLASAINWTYASDNTFAAYTANDTIAAGDYTYRNPAPKNVAAAQASQTPVADVNVDVLYHKTRAVQPSDNATTDKDITRTINLVDADKNDALIKTDKQTTHFHRDALYFDETTGQVVYGNWSANNDSKWAAYTAPDLSAENYLNPTPANLKEVDLTVDSQDQVANIAYSHKTHIIDPKHDVPGNKGGNNGGNTPNNGGNTPSNWPDNVPASDLIHVITRTIKYENAEGQEIAPAVTQTVRFTRTAVYDDITTATTNGVNTIDADYKAGSLDDVQKKNKNSIDDAATKERNAVDADDSLTPAAKSQRKDAIDKAAAKAKQNVENAKTADDANQATTDGDKNITGLNDAKNAADAKIDEAVKATKAKIAADDSLSAGEKQTQSDQVDKDAATAKSNIDDATDNDDITTATTNGVNTIDADYKAGSMDDVQKKNKAGIDDAANKAKAAVDSDASLTPAAKSQRKDAIDKAAAKAKQNVENAKTADDANQATTDGDKNINGLNAAKNAANAKIDAAVKETKAKIDADNALSADEKAAQKAKADEDAATAKSDIDDATDNDGITTATTNGVNTIDADYKAGSMDDVQKKNKAGIDDAANKAKTAVDADGSLTPDAKAKRKDAIDKAAAKAKRAIDQAQTADAALKETTDGQQVIAGLNAAKNAAAAKIDNNANQAKSDINNDDSLSGDEKRDQDSQVDHAAADAKAAIDDAINQNAIDQATESGAAVISKIHQSGLPMDEQKQAGYQFVDNEAAKVRAEIENDPYLTSAEKSAQLADLNAAVQTLKSAMANAKDSDSLEAVLTAGKQQIDAVYRKGVYKEMATPKAEVKPVVEDNPMPHTASRVTRNANQTIGLALTAGLSAFFLTKKRHEK